MNINFINDKIQIQKKFSHFLYDLSSLSSIEDTIQQISNNEQLTTFLNPFCPEVINVKATNIHKATQLFNYLTNSESMAHAYQGTTPLITLSSDIFKSYNYHSIAEYEKTFPEDMDYLNLCRLMFPQATTTGTQNLIAQAFFFHELGHLVLDKHMPELSDNIYRFEHEEPILFETLRNIEESFSDIFSAYIMDKLHPQLNFLRIYQNIRHHNNKYIEEKCHSIDPYDIAKCFNNMNNIQEKTLVADMLHIAQENALNLLENLPNQSVDENIKDKYNYLFTPIVSSLNKEKVLENITNQRNSKLEQSIKPFN